MVNVFYSHSPCPPITQIKESVRKITAIEVSRNHGAQTIHKTTSTKNGWAFLAQPLKDAITYLTLVYSISLSLLHSLRFLLDVDENDDGFTAQSCKDNVVIFSDSHLKSTASQKDYISKAQMKAFMVYGGSCILAFHNSSDRYSSLQRLLN